MAVGRPVSDSGSYFPLPRSGSPYAQVPIFPLISKQDATTLAKPKKGLQQAARQRNEPTASFGSHFFRKRNRVQEVRDRQMLQLYNSIKGGAGTSLKTRALFNQAAALKPPAHRRKQRCSPAINTERPNTPRHLTTGSPGKTQAQVSVKRRGKMLPFVVRDCH